MGKLRVLMVEDDLTQSMAYAVALENQNMEVERVYTAADAVATLYDVKKSFDVIVLDIHLPDMSGFTVLEAVRQKGIATPVIVLSMENRPRAMRLARELGAISYLPKPFLPTQLTEVVELVASTTAQRDPIDVSVPPKQH